MLFLSGLVCILLKLQANHVSEQDRSYYGVDVTVNEWGSILIFQKSEMLDSPKLLSVGTSETRSMTRSGGNFLIRVTFATG